MSYFSDVIICVTMRYGSTRLPGKALIDLRGGLTSVDILASQLRDLPYRLVICCPESADDDVIADAARKINVECFRGTLNVLKRMVDASEHYGASSFVRITGDDLFVDPGRLDSLVSCHGDFDFTFSDLPKGTESQVVNVSFAKEVLSLSGDETDYWDKQRNAAWQDKNMNFVPLSPIATNADTFAVELDTAEDAEVIRKTLLRLSQAGINQPFCLEDLIQLHRILPFPKSRDPIDREYFDD